jgi:hypothetical protein
MNWLARWRDEMARVVDFLDARPAVVMRAGEDLEIMPSQASGRAEGGFRRLLRASWRRHVSADDLFPLALLAFFPLVLPPPLEGLVWALMTLLGIAIVLRVWLRDRRGDT